MSALLDQFIEESRDLLEAAGGALLALERNPSDARAVNDLFRSVHTLKGASALFEFPALTKTRARWRRSARRRSRRHDPRVGGVGRPAARTARSVTHLVDAVQSDGRLPDDAASVSRDLIARLSATKGVVDARSTRRR